MPAHKAYTEAVIVENLTGPHIPKIHREEHGLVHFPDHVRFFQSFLSTRHQIPRWGYASYGLSVFPYALMFVMNVFCAGLVGDYSCGQILRTPILEESLSSRRRIGVEEQYDGVIGTLKEQWKPKIGDIGSSDDEEGSYVAVRMSMLTVPDLAGSGADSRNQLVVAGVCDSPVPGSRWKKTYRLNSSEPTGRDRGPVTRFTVSTLSHNGPPSQSSLLRFRQITWREVGIITISFLVALITPYALIYVMTGFHPGRESTVSPRAWMMAWLAADQFSSIFVLVSWLIWKKKDAIIPRSVHYVCLTMLAIPGIGGYVAIGRMFLTDTRFGTDLASADKTGPIIFQRPFSAE